MFSVPLDRHHQVIAICQIEMFWAIEQNTAQICQLIVDHPDVGIFAFPELALTGFHRQICEEAQANKVRTAIQQIATHCKRYGVTVLVGVPLVDEGDRLLNAYVVIDAEGQYEANWCKTGLTDSEQQIFSPAPSRKAQSVAGLWTNTLFCREASDIDWFVAECQDAKDQGEALHSQDESSQRERDLAPLDLVFWPSYICHHHHTNRETGMYSDARIIAAQLGVPIIQINWANALNRPELKGMGGSSLITSEGKIVYTLPDDKPCLGLYHLASQTLAIRPISNRSV